MRPNLSDFFSETLLPLVESIESQAALTVTTFKEIAESALNKVIVATNGAFLDTATVTPSATEDEVTLLLELHKTWNLFDLNLASDFGVEGLGLEFETTGSLGANITFDLAFGLGLHKDFGFYIDTDLTGVTVDARLDLNGFAGKGSLGFLQLDFADDVDNPTALSVVFEAGLNDLDNYQTVRFFDVNGDGLLAEEEFTYGIGDDLNPKDDKLDVGPDGEIIVTTTSIREPWVNLNKQGNAVDVVAGDFPTVLEVAASSLSAATAVNWNDNTTFDEAESIINEGKYRSRSQGSKTIFYFDANNNGKLDIGKRNVDPFSVLWSTLEPSEKNKSEIWVHSTNTTWVDSQGRVKSLAGNEGLWRLNLAYYFNENGGSLDDASEQISTKLATQEFGQRQGRPAGSEYRERWRRRICAGHGHRLP